MSNQDLDTALSIMPEKTRLKLLSDIENPSLLAKIGKYLDGETDKKVFETSSGAEGTSPDEDNNIRFPHSEGQENLYEMECRIDHPVGDRRARL